MLISGICEQISLLNYLFFVDKFTLEFNVINKDMTLDKLGVNLKKDKKTLCVNQELEDKF